MTVNTLTPSILSFAFSPFVPVLGTNETSLWALVIALVPRNLVGVVPFYIFSWLKKRQANEKVSLFAAGLTGSMVNTILVMNLIYFVFQDAYAASKNMEVGAGLYKAVLSVIFINGIPEAIVAGLATSAVCVVLLKILNKNQS